MWLLDRQTDAGQSDPYVSLCFAGDTINYIKNILPQQIQNFSQRRIQPDSTYRNDTSISKKLASILHITSAESSTLYDIYPSIQSRSVSTTTLHHHRQVKALVTTQIENYSAAIDPCLHLTCETKLTYEASPQPARLISKAKYYPNMDLLLLTSSSLWWK